MKIFTQKHRRAFTLIEALMSLGAGTMVLAAVTTSGVALQRSFAAVETYSMAEGDQLRVLDYIGMDCRRAASASVSNNVLTLTVPDYYDSNNNPRDPSNSAGSVVYGAGNTVTIAYSMVTAGNNSNFVRSVTRNGTTATSIIARRVASFSVTPQDLTASISCTIMFFPTFTRSTGSGSWLSGPSAPSDSLGNNGDYYVIDPTASVSSTVGDVYYKSGGAYSIVKNIKATAVYSNTFFRNASARQ